MTRNDTIAFLTCVLPDEGFYCAVVFDTAHPKPGVDKPRQVFFSTIIELADFLLGQDQQGRTVYHACASYQAPQNRKQSNAAAARALWLDIDCDPSGFKGKRPCYTDKLTAANAVILFSTAVGLPGPLFVDSGGGLHCYWPFETAVPPDRWQVYANELKRLCVQHALLADPARTADIASILRTPGTHNRKEGEILVQCDRENLNRFPGDAFAGLASTQSGRTGVDAIVPRSLPQREPRKANQGARTRAPVLARIEQATSYGSVQADFVADRCAQIDALRQSGSVEGWFLRVGVLAFCDDGVEKAHEWSANDYPEYDPRVVDDRLHRSRSQLTGATTCARLDAATPGVCEKCPFWGKITSPISVPTDPLDVRITTRTPFNGHAVNGVAQQFRPTIGGIELPQLKKPFRWANDGKLILATEDSGGDPIEITVSDFPVYLASVQIGELEASKFSYKFCRYLPQEGWRDVLIEARLMFGASSHAEFADRGVVIHEHKHFLNYVRHAVTEFHEEEETHVRYDQFGWKNDNTSFLYGRMLYTPAGPVEAIGAKEVVTRSQWVGPKKSGSLHAWTEAADSLFAADMEAYSAVVLASFAAPLMKFQSQDEGGAIVHLFTPGSGQGKTTALTGAWTVWSTREGLSLTNDDTRVSKPIAIGTLANLPVIYDELRDKDPEVIKRMVVMFTEGRDRMRGMVDGTIRHTKATWQTIMLSAANSSLIDQLQEDGVDAPAFRVLELSSQLPPSIDKTKGDRLKRIMNENAGHAGDAYLRYLCQPEVLSWTKGALDEWTQQIWQYSRLDSAHRFRVRAVGAIAVASAIVKKLELLHFNTDRIVEWLVNQLAAPSNKGTVSASLPADQATAALGAFLNAHMGEMLIVPDRFKPRQQRMVPLRTPNNRLSIRYEIAPNRVFISESVFRDWAIERGLSARHVLDALEKAQVLTNRKKQVTLSAGTNIIGGQVACMELNASHPAMSGVVASVEELQHDRVVDRI